MKVTPTPGSVSGRRTERAGDPLEGLVNLFDLSLVLAVGLLLAALSSIGATNLITTNPGGVSGDPLQAPPATSPSGGSGQGQEVGKVYRLSNGQYIFSPSAGGGGGATGATGSSSTPPAVSGVTGAPNPGATGTSQPDTQGQSQGNQTIDPAAGTNRPGV
ncbi:MAG: DUF2149 domain-containing protein [Solirubrobacterales bacterium]